MTSVPSIQQIADILTTIEGVAVAVVGDVMLDRYFRGSVTRVSPEAPVPVVDVENESWHLGGASNVAANLSGLGMRPLMCGIVGEDSSGQRVRTIARSMGLDDSGILTVGDRPTTLKTRIIGNNQQLARLDREFSGECQPEMAWRIIEPMASIPDLKAVVIADYNKGLLTDFVIKEVLKFANEKGLPVFVDPKKANFFSYEGVFLFKPNRKEASDALRLPLSNRNEYITGGVILKDRLSCSNLLLTLGSEGMMLFESSGEMSEATTHAQHIADVSGAGDTVMAALVAAYCGGATIRKAAAIANVAAGIVVAEPGIIAINAQTLLEHCRENIAQAEL